MHALMSRRPSGATVVALIALVLAASGTAVAAGRLVGGDSLIKKGSLSGNRLRRHTLTGKQIDLNRLGKVPSAVSADHATTATSATEATTAAFANAATNATNASNAGNANTVDGQPASSFEPASNFIRTGLVTAAAVGQIVPLTSFGPFTLTLDCVDRGGGVVQAQINATSTEANSDGYGTPMPMAGTSYDVLVSGPSAGFDESNANAADFFTPSGKTYVAVLTVGENYLGAKCFANALVTPS
jgi:hypothetical protein